MKINIETLHDTFKISYEQFQSSREEANRILDLYHNRQYTGSQEAVLERRGSPKETFNVIRLFSRMLIGYYSTLVNAVRIQGVQLRDRPTAAILNDIVNYIFRTNNFENEADSIKLDMLLQGFMCSYVDVEELNKQDEFGRPLYTIKIHHVPALEVLLDPMSRLDDYSDARYIHRFKWCTKEAMVKAFGKSVLSKLEPYDNFLRKDDTEFTRFYHDKFVGEFAEEDCYLLVHTIMTDDNNDTWEIYWAGEEILSKKKITFKEVKNPYRVQRLETNNNKLEYYGIFRDVAESQIAINQALIKIQQLINTNQVYAEKACIDDIDRFTDAVNRVNSVIIVNDLQGIKVEKLSAEAGDQYVIIDKALDRIQRILCINDAFLGMAYASDSGAKVKIQQNASSVALRYLTKQIEEFYRLLGKDIISLIKQYYTAHDVVRVADEYNAEKWLEINKPLMLNTGVMGPDGQPIMTYVWEEYLDPASGQPVVGDNNEIILVPVPEAETDIQFTDADVSVASVAYNDDEERLRMLMEAFLSGPLGQMLSSVNPVGYFQAGALALRETKVKHSETLAQILEETAMMVSQGSSPGALMMQQGMAPGQEKPKSTSNTQTGL